MQSESEASPRPVRRRITLAATLAATALTVQALGADEIELTEPSTQHDDGVAAI